MGVNQWIVTDALGEDHVFEEESAALRYAHMVAFTDRPTTVRNPGGTEWAVILRTTHYTIQVVREV